MKLYVLIEQDQQFNEASLKHAIATGVMGASMLGAIHANNASHQSSEEAKTAQRTHAIGHHKLDPHKQKLELSPAAKNIASEYNIDPQLAEEIVRLAKKYKKPGFPSTKDILAIVGIESSFQPDSVSGLSDDPAVGLMQVRPGKWNLEADDLSTPEDQIRIGSEILHKYYRKLKSPEAAIQAYNVGLTNYKQNLKPESAERYLHKYKQERSKSLYTQT